MLKGIHRFISPELLKALMEMGHGDEIVLGDSNFPSASHAQHLVRSDGHRIPDLLGAILPLFPLDYAVGHAAVLMGCNGNPQPSVWNRYREILNAYPEGDKPFSVISKIEFYQQAKSAYCIVATGESETFANIILRKGVIK
ncbi:MAG: fucose isomerase [Bacteroidales bacterium]|jgi:L-fucose mutarotase|nr:fucose isomerase [Bacteroidales bacterium]